MTDAVRLLQGKGASAPTSPRTPSPAASQLTHGSDLTALPAAKGDEASFSGAFLSRFGFRGQDGAQGAHFWLLVAQERSFAVYCHVVLGVVVDAFLPRRAC